MKKNNGDHVVEEISESQAKKELKRGFKKAKELLEDDEKVEKFLQRLEKKLKVIPKAGDTLAMVPIMASLVRMYIKKEYTDIPLGTIVAIISALMYVVSPFDIVPDTLPGGLGHIDDAAIVGACIKLIGSDIEEYQEWRKKNNKILEV